MNIVLLLVILLFSSILHEIMHGFVAERLGDPTARLMGRLTLDPRKHLDPFMSVLLPLLLLMSGSPIIFGAAKPVPVDPFNLKEGKKDMALVALAGPVTNIVIAVIASLLFRLYPNLIFEQIVNLNLLLAIFNLLPIPPLDGSKVISIFLSDRTAQEYNSLNNIGMIIIFFLLLFPIGGFSLGAFIGHLLTISQNILLP